MEVKRKGMSADAIGELIAWRNCSMRVRGRVANRSSGTL